MTLSKCFTVFTSTPTTGTIYDGLKSVLTVEQAHQLIKCLQAMCAGNNSRLHKFASNCKEVLEALPVKDRVKDLKDLILDETLCLFKDPLVLTRVSSQTHLDFVSSSETNLHGNLLRDSVYNQFSL